MGYRSKCAAIIGSLAVLALSCTSIPLHAAQTISGRKVGIVEAGSDGSLAVRFKQINKRRWGEYKVGADGKDKLEFQLEEVARDDDQVVLYYKQKDLTFVLDLAAEIVTFGPAESQEQLYEILQAKPAPNSVALASSTAGTEIDQFIRTLEYNPDTVVVRSATGSQVNPPSREPVRDPKGDTITVTTKTLETAGGPVTQFTLLNPALNVIYPGSVINVDSNLADGKPTNIEGEKGTITLSIDLPGGTNLVRTIEKPDKSSVEAAVKNILAEYSAQGDVVQNANSAMTFSTAYSKQQVSASLGFAAEWATGDADAKLSAKSDTENEVSIIFFRQKYYTVNVDPPKSPAAAFAADLPIEELRTQIDNSKPPGYISSVDYGRLLMIQMKTRKSELNIAGEAAFKQKFGDDGSASGNVKAEYDQVLRNSEFSAVVLGGNPSGIADMPVGNIEKLQEYLQSYIAAGSTYNEKNPGEAISYSVRFLKERSVAKVNLTTEYIKTETTIAKNGYIDIHNSCACTIGAFITYSVTGEPANVPLLKFADDDIKVDGHRYVDIPGDARALRMEIVRYETFGSVQTKYVVPGLEPSATGAPQVCVRTPGTFFAASAEVAGGRC